MWHNKINLNIHQYDSHITKHEGITEMLVSESVLAEPHAHTVIAF